MTTPTPAPSNNAGSNRSFSTSTLLKDITMYGGAAVAIVTAAVQTIPGASIPAAAQAVIGAIIPILTALMSIRKQQATNQAVSTLQIQLAAAKAASRKAGR